MVSKKRNRKTQIKTFKSSGCFCRFWQKDGSFFGMAHLWERDFCFCFLNTSWSEKFVYLETKNTSESCMWKVFFPDFVWLKSAPFVHPTAGEKKNNLLERASWWKTLAGFCRSNVETSKILQISSQLWWKCRPALITPGELVIIYGLESYTHLDSSILPTNGRQRHNWWNRTASCWS